MKKDWFVVATEGSTTDGRVIERAWIEQMAASYDPVKLKGARINLEHYRGIDPAGLFKAYGDVLAVKTEERDGKLCLLAKISPTDDMRALLNARQKVYPSIEINPNFADTGKAYLVGLAITDDPASLGVEMLEFSAAQGDKSPLAKRKQNPGNFFSAAQADVFIAQEDLEEGTGVFGGLLDRLTTAVEKLSGNAATPASKLPNVPEPAATAPQPDLSLFTSLLKDTIQGFAALQTEIVAKSEFAAAQQELTALKTEFANLKKELEQSPTHHYTPRPPATGGEGQVLADC